MSPYEQLLHLAFATPAEAARYLTSKARGAHEHFRAAGPHEQPFRFEQLRLGIAMSLLKLLADLGDHDESRQAQEVLHRALEQSRSPQDIDRIVGREARLFDQLYDNLYVNEQGEELLNLFGRAPTRTNNPITRRAFHPLFFSCLHGPHLFRFHSVDCGAERGPLFRRL